MVAGTVGGGSCLGEGAGRGAFDTLAKKEN